MFTDMVTWSRKHVRELFNILPISKAILEQSVVSTLTLFFYKNSTSFKACRM